MAKILLVEDDNNLREIYEARLMAEGYDIVSARDGEEALTIAMKEKPDLIISDVMMPKISGFDMLDILRTTEETKNAKVIMMTALSQAEDKERAEKLGADRYLVKSQVTLEDVAKVAKEVLEGKPAGSETPATATEPEETPAEEEPAAAEAPVAPAPTATAPTVPAPSAVPVVAAAPAVTQQPSAIPTPATPGPDTTSTTPAADPVTPAVPEPVTPAPVVAPEPVTAPQAAVTTGLDAVAASSTPPAPEPAVAPATSIPVGTPADEPTTTTPDPVTVESTETEEQAIAKQLKENLKQAEAPAPEAALESAPTTTEQPVTPEVAPTPDVTPAPPAPEPVVTPPEVKSEAGSKKVIEPINDINAPGPDLNKMATDEEHKEEATAPTVIQPTTPPVPTAAASQAVESTKKIDPNSIAL